jgi:hypothetical protein
MFDFLKTRITAEEAVILYLRALSRRYELNWPTQIIRLNAASGEELIHPDEKLAEYEFFLCTISLEMGSIMNLVPEKYDIIYKSLIKYMTENMNTGEYAKKAISQHYLPAIRRAELDGELPHEEVVFILSQKLDIKFNVYIGMALSEIVISHTGTWKDIFKKYNVV